ncbi:hypothetical protein MBRA_05008 [Methylobacterium brachiatum]|nr:hypothetical protein MBRA_05008 [Methylobacterium brachiatum]
MRLIRLALERYGAFTERTVTFRPDARLHVVLGANEAGKSTALAAVTDLLFGFEKTTRYAFLHDMPLLRLGAEVEAADGRRLAFRRRKGNTRTLIDAAEAPLPDDALAPFLGSISRTVFCRAFGLDAGSLRAGGREMVDVEGEVGASLFAAGSGLRGLTELQAALDAEAEGIFAPRQAKHRTFYQALERHETARKAIREKGLRAGDWRALNDEIAAAAQQLDALRAERERVATERARLERLKRARPIVAEIDALDHRIAADAGLAEADSAWIERLGEAGIRGDPVAGSYKNLRAHETGRKLARVLLPEKNPGAGRGRVGAGGAGADPAGRGDPGGVQRHQGVREGRHRPAPDRGRRPQGRARPGAPARPDRRPGSRVPESQPAHRRRPRPRRAADPRRQDARRGGGAAGARRCGRHGRARPPGPGGRGGRRHPRSDAVARGAEAARQAARAPRRPRGAGHRDPAGDGPAAQSGGASVAAGGRHRRAGPHAPAQRRHDRALPHPARRQAARAGARRRPPGRSAGPGRRHPHPPARARGRSADRHPGAARIRAGCARRRLRAPARRPRGRPDH